MTIRHLEVSGVRNLRRVRLEHCGRINIISGPNGGGKTSLLEAIFLLGMGRSFRSNRLGPLISHEMEKATVYGETLGADGQQHSIGLSRSRGGEQQIHIDRLAAKSLADLARILPLQVLNADSFSLVDGGPKTRRQFMDWGVFHVKPSFMDLWRRAQRALQQRNSLLRAGRPRVRMPTRSPGPDDLGFDAWERELAQSAELIDLLRREYMEAFLPHFRQMLACFPGLPSLSLDYKRGWREEESLLESLVASRSRDAEQGFTQLGPQRATLEIKTEGRPAAEVLSRGQQKLLVASLKLAQGAFLAEATDRRGVFLLDDLPAELDQAHRLTLCQLLDGMGSQVFITSVDADVLDGGLSMGIWSQKDEIRRFHVEQGEYRCLMK